MRVVVIEFTSLDGVAQEPGVPDEDTDGGFAHGGWTHPFFDPEVVGGAFSGALGTRRRCSTGGAPGRAWLRRGPTARVIRLPIR